VDVVCKGELDREYSLCLGIASEGGRVYYSRTTFSMTRSCGGGARWARPDPKTPILSTERQNVRTPDSNRLQPAGAINEMACGPQQYVETRVFGQTKSGIGQVHAELNIEQPALAIARGFS